MINIDLNSAEFEILKQRHRRYIDENPDLREFLERRDKEYTNLLEQLEEVKLDNIADPLPGVCNRRYFDKAIKWDFENASKDKPLSLIFIDVDNLKKINDGTNHIYGDKVLKYAAKNIKNACRDTDIVCRYGGDELVVILPLTDLENAGRIAERIRKVVYKPQLDENSNLSLSVTCGVASYPHKLIQSYEDLKYYADLALKKAKENGKNRTCIFSQDGEYKLLDDTI